ncbi:NAD-dependent succinate-semialdehyde dehydrogenase [Propioniciclava tarda]|uniref:NAD-dependent succinate-semialdehyde dehydrogenase n=1 Tax=Propioniciclava tarda TaxID=433330 RepID=A0A4Q9KM92_PROTD|nr:NAD-dependent succinate-semialdehyde dehydrogenase [Propioniciclava tarda]TBT95623.1 NAD-dependent succinate-semialdehyde dehydrogenase [Propioniciclava tarda]SMO47433.1 succinate-semialdehyde dehydrogenase / glutarate-semialdehyde dehydrogenase [Propioniciclava tarda]
MSGMDIAELLGRVEKRLLIGGEWRDASDGGTFDVENPATGQRIATLASATASDAKDALNAACAVQDDWARTPTRKRSDMLRAGFELVRAHGEELAWIMTTEMGKPLAEARGEVTYGNEFLRWFSEEAPRHDGRYVDTPEGNLRMVVRHKPVGPCLLITPWNFPLAMATRKIAPALAAGCTMVVKAAKLTPLTTQYFAQLMIEAGVPAGVLNVLPGSDAAAISSTLMADPRLRKVSFTGSTPVGKSLLKLAADNVLRTSMELGGNAPFLVFADADLDAAVEGAIAAKMRNIGEACTAANRFLVEESVAQEFGSKLAARLGALAVGDGTADGTQVGPLVEGKARDNVDRLVQDATARGGRALAGGRPVDGPGYFYEPTVLLGMGTDAGVFREEIFGPVAPIFTFRDEDEAVAMANDTEYGLASYVYTSDLKRAHRIGDRLEFGLLGLNAGVISNAAAPFGGVKQSGLGREGGAEGIAEYTTIQYMGMANPWA